MKCINHDEIEAVAFCSYCQQPVCKECSLKTYDKIICKNRCEEDHINSEIFYKFKKDHSSQYLIFFVSFKCILFSTFFLLHSYGLIIESKYLKSKELYNMGIFAGTLGVALLMLIILTFMNRLKVDCK